jgi:hypothetical protein
MPTELRLFADYFQIHVLDAQSDADLGEAWTGPAIADRLAVAICVLDAEQPTTAPTSIRRWT